MMKNLLENQKAGVQAGSNAMNAFLITALHSSKYTHLKGIYLND